MRRIITLVAACAGFGCMHTAAADTLRCGSALIEPGDDATYVLENCIEPTQPGADVNAYQVYIPQLQRWRIVRQDGQFRAVVVIGADGRVEDIEFERRRD
jgi:hypothetical protein